MNDPRAIARAAVGRLGAVLDALANNPSKTNAVLDVEQPLIAAFDALIDEIDSLKRKVAELEQKR